MRRVAIRVARAESEIARARLLDLEPGGFEERELPDAVELVTYVEADAEARLRKAFANVVATDVDPDWEDAWRAFHRPVVAGGVWLGPPWEKAPAERGAVVIDPGRAFGTGAHATTRLCVELLAETPRGSLLDVGCGSGVLAIAGVRLGFEPVAGIDSDPVAVEVAWENAVRNGVDVTFRVADARAGALPPADVVVANLSLEAVLDLPRIDARVAITAGYLARETVELPGLTVVKRVELDGWAADKHARE